MSGIAESPIRATARSSLVPAAYGAVLFILSGGILGLLFVGCSGGGHGVPGGGNGYVEYPVTSCSDLCDSSCSDYSPSACTASTSSGSGSGTTTGNTGDTGSCSDSADPACGNYDPIGSDGGGTGDGGCDPYTCGDVGTGDSGAGSTGDVGSGNTGGDTGVDTGGDTGDAGGDTGGGDSGGDGGDDWGDGGIVHLGTAPSVRDAPVRSSRNPFSKLNEPIQFRVQSHTAGATTQAGSANSGGAQ